MQLKTSMTGSFSLSEQVTRLEDYGAFVEFEYEGKKLSALLQSEEAKVRGCRSNSAQQGSQHTLAACITSDASMPQAHAVMHEQGEYLGEHEVTGTCSQ
jgi:hypothetical protein